MRIGYAADIAEVGIDPEIGTACLVAAKRLADRGASVEELEFSVADGGEAYRILRGVTMVTRFFDSLDEIEKFEPNLRGNIETGAKLTIGEVARAELWHRWRGLFERIDHRFSDIGQSSGGIGAVRPNHCRASDRTANHRAAFCRAEDPRFCKARA
jgi:Asp-tRNA(Asn)/Glu-tRNA(Gln) amidotransferase A subunit family amidase